MNIETLRDFCLSLPGATESFPFDEYVLVFKVNNKMFLFTDLGSAEPLACVKADPEKALEWRDRYDFVRPGYHISKKYWNTVDYERAGDELMKKWICHSWCEVVRKFPAKERIPRLAAIAECYPQYMEI